MRQLGLIWVLLFLWTGLARSDEPSKPVKDIWEAAQLDQVPTGYFHTRVKEVERNDQKILQTTQELNLKVKRFGDLIQLRMITGTEETPDGKVVGVFMHQFLGGGRELVLKGVVKENNLEVDVDKGRITRTIPWNDKVIGLNAQEQLFQQRKVKPGDRLTFQSYEPSLNTVITIRANIMGEEDVVVLGTKRRLLKATLVADKIEVPGATVQLPPLIVWMDKQWTPVCRQIEIPGIGKIFLTRASREVALAGGDPSRLIDIGRKTLIGLNRKIFSPHATKEIVYRITFAEDEKAPETALMQDDRQQILEVKNRTLELRVRAVRAPGESRREKVKEEYLKSSYFLDSDHERVGRLARTAIGMETDAWRKAQRIERWVHNNMTSDNRTPFAPAGQIAENLRGDCRQHAMLATAMCRAVGVPARPALGLVYAEERGGKPVLGFHMWLEVWIKGHWLALDPIAGRGSIGAAHIKIADHSWHETQSLTPLLSVTRVLGKMSVEIVRVEGEQ